MNIDLIAAAHEQMLEQGLVPEFPPDGLAEVAGLHATLAPHATTRDLRSLLWSSIDYAESRDLDQVEYAEAIGDGVIRLLIGIADVDAYVPPGSAIDRHASVNTVSVYAGVTVFPMLPERLSTDVTSLNEGADRHAIVTELHVAQNGSVTHADVYRAFVRNHAKLDYVTLSRWLEGGEPPDKLSTIAGLEEQVRLHAEAARRLERVRRDAGALDIETVEARLVVENGRVVDIAVVEANAARDIIESFMVAANVAMARFLARHGMPAIRRVVRTPHRWSRIVEIAADTGETLPGEPDSRALASFLQRMKLRDPAGYADLSLRVVKLLGAGEYVLDRTGDSDDNGHFGLAVAEYTHSTAPNRRYPDLTTQRLAKAALDGANAPFTDDELDAIAKHCTKQEDAARKVERTVRKMAAAELMSGRVGDVFDGIVTGAAPKGTFVRLTRPAVEGRITANAEGLDVGETVRVRLDSVDAARGHIDFSRVPPR